MLIVESGPNVGDTADVWLYQDYSYGDVSKVVMEVLVGFRNPPVYDESWYIGFLGGSSTAHDLQYGIDYQTGEYYFDGATRQATMPNDNQRTLVRVIIDYENDQTTIEQKAGVNESETRSGTTTRIRAGIGAENVNGVSNIGKNNDIQFIRYNAEI